MTENSSVIPSSTRFKSSTILRKNEPAPKVPRRDSLAASDSDTNGPICQSGTTSSGGGIIFDRADRQEVHGTVEI